MKLIDAIKQKGNPYWIPNCSRNDLPNFFKELGFTSGAEIGVYTGSNLKKYCKSGLTVYGIDQWVENKNSRAPKVMEWQYNIAVKKLARYSNCTLIHKTSMDALNDFPHEGLDFVYIDANHDFGCVAMDLMKWTDKVKKGGIIAGHDYYSVDGYGNNSHVCSVKYVVDAFVKTYKIDNWYILGQKKPSPGEIIDRSLSFMFFKNW